MSFKWHCSPTWFPCGLAFFWLLSKSKEYLSVTSIMVSNSFSLLTLTPLQHLTIHDSRGPNALLHKYRSFLQLLCEDSATKCFPAEPWVHRNLPPPHYKARLSFYLCLWLGGSGHCYGFLHPSESFGWCRLQQLHTVSGRIRPKSVLPGSLILSDIDFLSSVFILRYRSRYIFVAC